MTNDTAFASLRKHARTGVVRTSPAIVAAIVGVIAPFATSCAATGAHPNTFAAPPKIVQSGMRFRKEYVLAPGDQIEVIVRRVPEASHVVTLRPDGYITLPLLDDVKAFGLTPSELDANLTELFSARLVDPDVTVIATNVRTPMVYVLGEVNTPRSVPLRDADTAMQAIILAGGLRHSAARQDIAIIRLADDGHLQALTVSAAIRGQPGPYMALAMTRLQADDLIFVPESGRGQAIRFIDDFLIRPLGTINAILGTLVSLRFLREVTR